MDQKIATKWVAALRSGEYEQGKGALREHDLYCCLGVLCSLAFKEDPSLGKWDAGHTRRRAIDGKTGLESGTMLPTSVMEWADMKSYSGDIGYSNSLAARNDTGETFPEIADHIEQNWSKL